MPPPKVKPPVETRAQLTELLNGLLDRHGFGMDGTDGHGLNPQGVAYLLRFFTNADIAGICAQLAGELQ